MATAQQIIAAINPEIYSNTDSSVNKEIKELLEKDKLSDAIKKVSPTAVKYSGDFEDGYSLELEGFTLDMGGLEASQTLTYETYAESLEPIYYYILDFMDTLGLKTKKIVDNFTSAIGSANFSEMGQKKTIMQKQAMELMGSINTVVRSILNLVYDLKEFKIRLDAYENLKNKDKKEAALLSLKQVWMDKVDMNKGNSSIKAMAFGQAGFVTLIDAFLSIKNPKDVSKIDLNERVKRILVERLSEFEIWLSESEQELRKRYSIEKTYLKSQVNSLQLYTRWVKPYLQYAKELEQGGAEDNPSLVKMFNRTILQLTLLGTSKISAEEMGKEGSLPDFFGDEKLIKRLKKKGDLRDYYKCVLVDFVFRTVPQQGVHIGKVDVTFRAYSLNQQEIDQLNKALEEDDLESGLKFIQGATDESLGELKKDIDFFLGEDKEEEKKKEEKSKEDSVNPFLALIGYYNKKEEKSEKKDKKKEEKKFAPIREDNYYEKYLRNAAAGEAISALFTLFDIYKKSHGMASYT
jgi:hypothetical protein